LATHPDNLHFIAGGGEMGARVRAHDWSATELGPPHVWPLELRSAVSICLNSTFPTAIYWGPLWRLIYNDAWAHIPGERHPWALGRTAKEVWTDIWDVIEPQFRQVMTQGVGFSTFDQLLPIERNGRVTETYWNYSLTPIRGLDGSVVGIFNQGNETTAQIFAKREREAQFTRLREMFRQAPGAIAVLSGPTHVVELINDSYAQLIGHRDVVGKPVADALPEIAEQGFVDLLDRVYRSGEPYVGHSIPVRLQRNPQTPAETSLLDFVYQPIRDSGGNVNGIFVEATDVTQRVRMETALRASEERLSHALSAGGSIGTWDWDVRSNIVTADERFARLYGVDPNHAAHGAPLEEYFACVHPDDIAGLRRAIDDALASGEIFTREYRLLDANGAIRWVSARGRCTLSPEGTPIRFPGVSFDVTDRKRVEEALRLARANREFALILSERQRRASSATEIMRMAAEALGLQLNANRVGFSILPDEHTLEFAACWTDGLVAPLQGRGAVTQLGVGVNKILRSGETVVFADAHDDTRLDRERFERIGARSGIAVPLLRGERWVADMYVHASTARTWLPEEIALAQEVAELTWDAVERAKAAAALADSEERFRAITNSIDQMIWSTLPDGYHDYYNDRWYEYTGVPYGSTDGEAWNDMFHPDDRERAWQVWRRCLETGETYHIEYRLRHRTGEYRWVLGRAQPVRDRDGSIVRWFGTCTDIQEIVDAREVLTRSREELEREVRERTHELLQAEAQLRQSQKMDAVGQLTGGIAHDFNNMLAVIMGGLNLLNRRLQRGETDVSKYIEGAMEGATRAAALTQRLLAFARQQPLAPEPIDANRMVAGMTELLTRALGADVRVETVLSAGLWKAKADPNQLENAILNLAVNARDAMPNGGRLTIETANAHVDEHYADEFAIAPGQYILISVTDTGTGMTADVIAKAFEPFFTTKAVGRGTGLGLSQVFGFVRQSGGHVKIYSEVGLGTTLKLYLPRYYGTAEAAMPQTVSDRTPSGGRHEVILVVEDEPRVRAFSVDALSDLGYTALAAANGAEALRLIDSEREISMLFTDIVMPDMSGRQLADAAMLKRPQLKVLFTTGYSRNAVVHNGVIDPGTNYLAKPFGIQQLAQKVRSILDGVG
jgi:PAS domain S-box-containing protein